MCTLVKNYFLEDLKRLQGSEKGYWRTQIFTSIQWALGFSLNEIKLWVYTRMGHLTVSLYFSFLKDSHHFSSAVPAPVQCKQMVSKSRICYLSVKITAAYSPWAVWPGKLQGFAFAHAHDGAGAGARQQGAVWRLSSFQQCPRHCHFSPPSQLWSDTSQITVNIIIFNFLSRKVLSSFTFHWFQCSQEVLRTLHNRTLRVLKKTLKDMFSAWLNDYFSPLDWTWIGTVSCCVAFGKSLNLSACLCCLSPEDHGISLPYMGSVRHVRANYHY